jgi:hypothetical protein
MAAWRLPRNSMLQAELIRNSSTYPQQLLTVTPTTGGADEK